MDTKKILIMNLAKGRIGEDGSALMGAMMITKIQLAAMSRVDVPEEKRQDFYLYVDEFQNFATESFANILSEARKYRLNLIIAHQYVEQLDEIVRPAVFGNVGTIICFRVGAADAEFLLNEFAPYFDEEDLVNLTKYEVYMKLMIDGVSSTPFSAVTLPPLSFKRENNDEKIIKVSREKYSKPVEIVEDKIARWSGMMDEDLEEEKPQLKKETFKTSADLKKKVEGPAKDHYFVNCYECGELIEVNFRPDGVRPVYCKKCFKDIREQALHKEPELPPLKEVKEKPIIPPVAPPPSTEISLNEALRANPIPFAQKKEATSPKTNPESTPTTQKNSLINEKTDRHHRQFHTLKPGQVVKF